MKLHIPMLFILSLIAFNQTVATLPNRKIMHTHKKALWFTMPPKKRRSWQKQLNPTQRLSAKENLTAIMLNNLKYAPNYRAAA